MNPRIPPLVAAASLVLTVAIDSPSAVAFSSTPAPESASGATGQGSEPSQDPPRTPGGPEARQPVEAADRAASSQVATPDAPTPPPDTRLVVVFPFENESEDRSLYWASEALADGLDREIRRSGGTVVEREERLDVVEDLGVPTLSTLTLASQIRAAEELGAGTLVTGRFTAGGGTITVHARVVDVAAGRTGAWVTTPGSVREIFALQRTLYRSLRPLLPAAGGPAPPSSGGGPEDGVPQEAYEFLLKSFFEDSLEKRELLLRRSLGIAPDYLRAQVELARIYVDTDRDEKAAAALSRILTRDGVLAAEAQNLLAEIEIGRQRAGAAESALRTSLASHETARAHILLAKLALARGALEEARVEGARARALDPTDPELREIEDALLKSP